MTYPRKNWLDRDAFVLYAVALPNGGLAANTYYAASAPTLLTPGLYEAEDEADPTVMVRLVAAYQGHGEQVFERGCVMPTRHLLVPDGPLHSYRLTVPVRSVTSFSLKKVDEGIYSPLGPWHPGAIGSRSASRVKE